MTYREWKETEPQIPLTPPMPLIFAVSKLSNILIKRFIVLLVIVLLILILLFLISSLQKQLRYHDCIGMYAIIFREHKMQDDVG